MNGRSSTICTEERRCEDPLTSKVDLPRFNMLSSAGLQKMVAVMAGVLASCMLVLHNRFLLVRLDDGLTSSMLLVTLHNVSTYVLVRLRNASSQDVRVEIPVHVSVGVSACTAASLLLSNLLLSRSSVAFHQLARVFMIPAGGILDYLTERRQRTIQENLIITIIFAICLSTSTSISGFTASNCLIASGFVLSSVGVASIVRRSSTRFGFTSEQLLEYVLPYSIFYTCSSLVLRHKLSDDSVIMRLELGHAPTLLFNCVLAVAVQYLSTWTMQNISAQAYAVLAQVKTGTTILFGYLLLREYVSMTNCIAIVAICFLSICLIALEMNMVKEQGSAARLVLEHALIGRCFPQILKFIRDS